MGRVSPPPLHGLNLNSLVALDALLSEGSVTRAARRVGITQPAMSQTLARLRELFDDPLLVRTGRGLVRTPRAEAMLLPLSEALLAVDRAVQLGMAFDPATSTRIFRVAMTDLHLITILPGMLRAFDTLAPDVRIEADPMSVGGLADKISSGEIDLVVGFLVRAMPGLRIETLLTDQYVCLLRRGHRLARRKRIELADYAKEQHLSNTPVRFVPRALAEVDFGFRSRAGIKASVPYMLTMPALVRSTDLIATIPRRLLDALPDREGIVIREAPSELPSVEHSMWWHPRFDRDPAHLFLRDQVRAQLA